jgi:glutathione S-transferase
MYQLYRFEYSCYARKVQCVLDLMGVAYQAIDVPFGDRTELAELTGGYIQVPVLVSDTGQVIKDSRNICLALTATPAGAWLVPEPLAGPVWAYADWCEGPFEDVMFRIASPQIRRQFPRAADRALFTFIKERKFGTGCVEQWERDHDALITRAREMMQPTLRTLTKQPFLFGDKPTLADAALFGQFAMLRVPSPNLPGRIDPRFDGWMNAVESWKRTG